jgi:hypothetical protein
MQGQQREAKAKSGLKNAYAEEEEERKAGTAKGGRKAGPLNEDKLHPSSVTEKDYFDNFGDKSPTSKAQYEFGKKVYEAGKAASGGKGEGGAKMQQLLDQHYAEAQALSRQGGAERANALQEKAVRKQLEGQVKATDAYNKQMLQDIRAGKYKEQAKDTRTDEEKFSDMAQKIMIKYSKKAAAAAGKKTAKAKPSDDSYDEPASGDTGSS